MNESAKAAFQALIEELLASVKGAKGLLKEQAPEIVKELVKYKTIMTAYDTVCTLIFGGLIAFGTCFVASYFPESTPGCPTFFKTAILALDLLFSVGCVLSNFNDFIKLKTAPRLYVLEYVKNMVTSEKKDE